MIPKAFLFDLDGVLVDTARFHYLAWKRLASSLGFDLSERDNERLKGVSRMESLEIVLGIGGISATLAERESLAERKNQWYVEFLSELGPRDVLPNSATFVQECRLSGLKTAVASASKNAVRILKALELDELFDVIVDGNLAAAKPDPDVFLKAAKGVGVPADTCVVFEDSSAGIEAARNAGMHCVGVGRPGNLVRADIVVSGLSGLTPRTVISQLLFVPRRGRE